MEARKLLLNTFICLCLFGKVAGMETATAKSVANWTVLVYMDADNSLSSFASYNITDMSAGLASLNGLNVLVQWNLPKKKETWRYKITPGSKIDAGSFAKEMGYNPSIEIVNAMQWVVKTYPANHYALILWDHGSGVEDFYPDATQSVMRTITNSSTWLKLLPSLPMRGLLYDEEEQTCLTNPGLLSALGQIKKLLGRNLDLIAMDACLMAMVEVAYQMNGFVNTFVGSQQTVPGCGYPYSQFIKPLSLNPASTSSVQLAQSMVSAYQSFYTTQDPTSDFTLAAIDVTSINLIKQNIDQFITAVGACNKIDAASTKNMILSARKAAISFEMPEYIDLYSFYANIFGQIKKVSPKSFLILKKQNKKTAPTLTKALQDAQNALSVVIQDGLTQIGKVVLQAAAGPAYAGAKGISIYYPSAGSIDPSYPQTLFAQNTSWMKFIELYQ